MKSKAPTILSASTSWSSLRSLCRPNPASLLDALTDAVMVGSAKHKVTVGSYLISYHLKSYPRDAEGRMGDPVLLEGNTPSHEKLIKTILADLKRREVSEVILTYAHGGEGRLQVYVSPEYVR